jgi:hypothetical protein
VSGTGSLTAQYVAYLVVTLPLAAILLRPALGMARYSLPALASRRVSTA